MPRFPARKPRSASPASGSSLAPLSQPVFRAVWIASLASNFGGMIQSVGASWLMTSITPSSEMVALVQASVTLPIMLLSLLAGAFADTYDRRHVMVVAQIFMLLVSIGLSICAFAGLITPWLLLTFTFLIGCGAAFNGPAWQASVADMVPREQVPGAVALNSMGFNIARSVGPAVGGAIVAAAGAAAAFAVNSVSYFALLVVLARWRPVRPERKLPRERIGRAMLSGIRYAFMSPAILTVLIRSLIFGLGASSVSALMPLLARDVIGGGPLTYGLLLGSFGVGAVGGAIGSRRLRVALSPERLIRWACVCFAAGAASAGASTTLLITMPALLLAGASWVLALSTFNITVQLNSPRWVVARALALYQMAAFGGMAAGSWLWGRTAESLTIGLAMAVAAGVLLLCALVGLRLRLPSLSDLDLAPLREWQPPETALDIKLRSGPIVITVELRIDEADIPEFLQIMTERRRIRLRDGARHWTLMRDTADPEVWIERFDLPNWIEYIRHNNRLTAADAWIPERVHELHRGDKPPRIRRLIERQPDTLGWLESRLDPRLTEPLTDARRFG